MGWRRRIGNHMCLVRRPCRLLPLAVDLRVRMPLHWTGIQVRMRMMMRLLRGINQLVGLDTQRGPLLLVGRLIALSALSMPLCSFVTQVLEVLVLDLGVHRVATVAMATVAGCMPRAQIRWSLRRGQKHPCLSKTTCRCPPVWQIRACFPYQPCRYRYPHP